MKVLILSVFASFVPLFAHATGPQFKHVVTVVFENTSFASAMKQPYFAKVASKGALFSNFFAETHPSQPNYIAMVAGDTLGVHGDANVNLNATHIGNLLEAKGLSWKVYAENLPSPCFLGASQGRYARKHVPFLSFLNVQGQPSECAKIVEAGQFQRDLSAHSLPEYAFYTPNLDNDGHDTGGAYASQWLQATFDSTFSQADLMKDTLFVITFDESDNYLAANQVYTVLLGANVIPGQNVTAAYSHYSVLRTIEENFGLGTMGRNDSKNASLSGIWK